MSLKVGVTREGELLYSSLFSKVTRISWQPDILTTSQGNDLP